MRRILIYMSSGMFLTIAMLVILWTIVLARTGLVLTQDPSEICSQIPESPYYVNNPITCSSYWRCENANDLEPVEMVCEEGGNFDEDEQSCRSSDEFPCEDPEPVDPEPVDPEPVDPEPVDPEPVDPEPVDPEPVDPEPVDPEPVDPEPVDPEPVDPEPVDPEPVNPICSQLPSYPWLVNNPKNCRAYWNCTASDDEPIYKECDNFFNFDEENQRCSLTIEFPCEDPTDQPQRQNVCNGLSDGHLINNPTGCRSYFECSNGIALPKQCDIGFNFNEELQICDRPSFTSCTNDDFKCPSWGISRWEIPGSCTKYNLCFEGQHRVDECAEGLNFDSEIALCALQEEAGCTRDLCPLNGGVDNIVTFPSENDCEHYFICHGGNPELQICAPGTHWNQERQRCERPEDAECEVENEPPVIIECPPGPGLVTVPHPNICRKYFICLNGESFEQACADGLLFDVFTLICRIDATCADGATLRSTKWKKLIRG